MAKKAKMSVQRHGNGGQAGTTTAENCMTATVDSTPRYTSLVKMTTHIH